MMMTTTTTIMLFFLPPVRVYVSRSMKYDTIEEEKKLLEDDHGRRIGLQQKLGTASLPVCTYVLT